MIKLNYKPNATCFICKKPFYRIPSLLKADSCCSNKCMGLKKKGKKRDELFVKPYSIPRGSIPWNKGLKGFRGGINRVERLHKLCHRCHKSFEILPSDSHRKYCSNSCLKNGPKTDEIKRFWDKVKKTDNCWEWQAALKDGYGVFRTANSVTVRAHKWLWESVNGKTPIGLELDHLCINRKCVQPSHLEAVTHKVNSERAPVGKRNWRTLTITHCPHGHEYNDLNTKYVKRGRSVFRACRKCQYERLKAWRKKKSSALAI